MENRFVIMNAKSKGVFGLQTKVIVDTQTGVQYLYALAGYGAGLTVLLDSDGTPLLASCSSQNRQEP